MMRINLETPIEATGKFDDFGVGVQTGGLIGTTVKFIANPVTTTLQRLIGKEFSSDGTDVCGLSIGPDNRSVVLPDGCK